MRITGLLKRRKQELPGVIGTARVGGPEPELLRRLSPGDVVVLDHVDLDRRTVDRIVAADAAAVVNAAPSISGRFPVLGPERLLRAGVVLVDGAGPEVLRAVRDGARVRVHEGAVYEGERELARGTCQTADTVADQLVEARTGMVAQLEAFSADVVEFLRQERALFLEGVGFPELDLDLHGAHVLVVAANGDADGHLRSLRGYLREHRPRLVGVEGGADLLARAGYPPDLIVGDPATISQDTLRCGAPVVVPAHHDGYAPALDRLHDLGVEASGVASGANPEDLALLLVDHQGAAVVTTVGFGGSLEEFLDRGRTESRPSMVVTRLKLGAKYVDARTVAAVHRRGVPAWALVALLGVAVVVLLAALLLSGVAGVYLAELGAVGGEVLSWLGGVVA
ncbi:MULTISPECIES: putative cytokinetic ring protein SteA [Actinoalloteichus]|uniref:Membrane-anchored protein n=1 Tax=Actinoalloteichus caeruleus DSM 43889 TaxID=1120930 RepID=A0ABT1JH97_ACTCY|nr:putative cytokinetic ring protein SteA [Actinoalloteichus caeruleus]MCP2331574.1 putative membrane-anchored protein [Actinoalloteichus caeruleus DSM 43889]